MVMYKIDRRGGVQKSYTRTDPMNVRYGNKRLNKTKTHILPSLNN